MRTPSLASRDFRVVFFCPSVCAERSRLEAPVRQLLEALGGPPSALAPLVDVGSLHVVGWRLFLLRSLGAESAARALSVHLGEAACALATELQATVLGLYVDARGDSAILSRCAPGRGPQTYAARRQGVLGCAAEWVGVPAADLAPLFGLEVAGAHPPDEEDRFVEGKLSEAEGLMLRWRQQRSRP